MRPQKYAATSYTITIDAPAGWGDIHANEISQKLRALAEKATRDGVDNFRDLPEIKFRLIPEN